MVSIRRFEKEGRFSYLKKGIKLNLYRAFKGEIRNDEVVKYEFDAFNKPESTEDLDFFNKIETQLLNIEKNSRSFSRRIQKQGGGIDIKQVQPKINEYAHLVKELDAYLNKKERREQRHQRLRDFFKPRCSPADTK
jgi:hypothetical protein